jgi:hypothetical protein
MLRPVHPFPRGNPGEAYHCTRQSLPAWLRKRFAITLLPNPSVNQLSPFPSFGKRRRWRELSNQQVTRIFHAHFSFFFVTL